MCNATDTVVSNILAADDDEAMQVLYLCISEDQMRDALLWLRLSACLAAGHGRHTTFLFSSILAPPDL